MYIWLMNLQFQKYQAAGNDFIIFDNRSGEYSSLSVDQRRFLCDRHQGVGADGIILINAHPSADFEMVYFNSDGNSSTLCGNGGRCAVAFAFQKGIIQESTTFLASDGWHKAERLDDGQVRLQMKDVAQVLKHADGIVTDTGSPHLILFTHNTAEINVNKEGAAIRYSEPFKNEGINVNFVEKISNNKFRIRTYERGVEAETLACGTGAVAAALAVNFTGISEGENQIFLKALGGDLRVDFQIGNQGYHNIYLQGSATYVFSGQLTL